MPAFNFQVRFASRVEQRLKNQTMRADRKDGRPHARLGDVVALYTGMRTRSCRRLGYGQVNAIFRVTIDAPARSVTLDGDAVRDLDRFARADGFFDGADLFAWVAATHGDRFEGNLYMWIPCDAEGVAHG